MDNTTLTAQVVARIRYLHDEEGHSFSEIVQKLKVEFADQFWTKDKIQKIARKHEKLQDLVSSVKSDMGTDFKQQKTVDVIRAWLGDTFDAASVPGESTPTERRTVIVIADMHSSPDKMLTQMVIDEDPDVIVLGGDLLDSKQISRHAYNPAEKSVSLQDEIATMRAWVEHLAQKTTAKIWVMKGNHDAWAERNIAELIPHEIMFLVKSPLDLIVDGIPRVELAFQPMAARLPYGQPVELGESQYMMLVGDAVVSHANFTGKNPGDSSKKLYEYIKNFRRYLGWPDISLCIQTHTHKSSINEYEGGWFTAVEPGSGGTPAIDAYKVNGYETKWSASPIGAVQFKQDLVDGEWKTVRSSARLMKPYR